MLPAVVLATLFSTALFAAGPADAGSNPAHGFDLIAWNHGRFIYGADYYPEAWNEGQWEKDATMMQAAGINFVRLAEFSWVKMEPSEGHFDFAWLNRALKVLDAHGIKAVLGTPTASPPAWLMARYPEIAAVDEHGVRYRYGSRRNYCLHNPDFLAATRRIVTAMAEHYKNDPRVIGWQTDNELGDPQCYDRYCLEAFQKWCQTKYKTLDAVNKAWGLVFWGHTVNAWSEIPLPWNTLGGVHNPSLELDYHRYFSDSTLDYVKLQTGILRKIAPHQAITHNEMGMFDNIDYSELNTALDFVAWDNYPMFGQDYSHYTEVALAHDLMRGSKRQNFMVMEEEGGLPGWTTFWGKQAAPGYYRLWAWQAIAHGADGICYFRWRTSPYGTEQYWQGILDQDSYPNARYQTVAKMGKEVAELKDLLEGSHVVSLVGLLVSPDSRWAFHIQPLVKEFSYDRQLHLYYDALRRNGVNVDVLFPQMDFSRYRVLIAPSLFVVTPELASKLDDFVRNGGALVLSYRSGVKDEHNLVTRETLPGPLAKLAGIAIHDFDPQINQKQEIVESDRVRYPAGVWYDVITPDTAKVLDTYGLGYYKGEAAVTRNSFGKGVVIYVGTQPDSAQFYERLLAPVARATGITAMPSIPEGVELAEREKDGKKIIFLLNYTDQPHTVILDQRYRDALSGQEQMKGIVVNPFDVRILTAP